MYFFLMTSACFKEVNKVTGSIGPQSMRRDVTKGKRRLRWRCVRGRRDNSRAVVRKRDRRLDGGMEGNKLWLNLKGTLYTHVGDGDDHKLIVVHPRTSLRNCLVEVLELDDWCCSDSELCMERCESFATEESASDANWSSVGKDTKATGDVRQSHSMVSYSYCGWVTDA